MYCCPVRGKGFFKGACHGCSEIGHRVADCPKNDAKETINSVSEAQEEDRGWQDEEAFENEGWGYLAAMEVWRPPPGLQISP